MPEVVERVARNLNSPLPKDYQGFTWMSSRSTGLTIDNRFVAQGSILRGETRDSGALKIKDRMKQRLCANAAFVRLMHHGMAFNIDVEDDRGQPFTRTSMTRADC